MEGTRNGLAEIYCRRGQCLLWIEWKYESELSGSNSRIDEVEAANGERRLKRWFRLLDGEICVGGVWVHKRQVWEAGMWGMSSWVGHRWGVQGHVRMSSEEGSNDERGQWALRAGCDCSELWKRWRDELKTVASLACWGQGVGNTFS